MCLPQKPRGSKISNAAGDIIRPRRLTGAVLIIPTSPRDKKKNKRETDLRISYRVLRSEDLVRLSRELAGRGQRGRLAQRQRRLECGLRRQPGDEKDSISGNNNHC